MGSKTNLMMNAKIRSSRITVDCTTFVGQTVLKMAVAIEVASGKTQDILIRENVLTRLELLSL